MKLAEKKDTKTHILDVAERHFAIYGFAGTTLRGIIKEADVNVAAVAYHFGSKEDLYSAVIERFAKPVVEEQLSRLRKEIVKRNVKLTNILTAFYEPPIALIKSMGKRGATLSLFLGRCQTEQEPIYSMIDKHFAPCRDQFLLAMRQVLPGLSKKDYHWNFEFMLSLIVCFLTRQQVISKRYTANENWQVDDVVSRLVGFCTAGMQDSK
ncbi:MAG: TetR/AcrR family transcriptional regulator [Candidatus Obscuribacterales bacterium]|nr:TetR/AcrR family transcriptional regulator [Candidatus Obscuribacterales bacterium]